MSGITVLRAERWADVEAGQVRSPAVVVVDGDRIQSVNPVETPPDSTEIDLGDVTLLPGLMDMELNLLIGGPGGPEGLPNPMHGVQDDPAYRTLRGAVNAKTTLEAGFTTVPNLGLMVKTGGYLLDVALQHAIDQGWHVGPRIFPAGHAVTPYGGHLDPTVFQRLAPGIMPLSVAEGIANGVDDVRGVRALSNSPRRQADQGFRIGRRDVTAPRRVPSSTPMTSSPRSPTMPTAWACASQRTPSGTVPSGPASGPASTASNTVSSRPTTQLR
jgi:imidazolonepropionase-like amidohydrolase